MENYYPMLIVDNTDDEVDYVVFVNNNIQEEEFEKRVDKAIQELCDEDYDYDGAYWNAICKKLTDLDFYTYYAPKIIYY